MYVYYLVGDGCAGESGRFRVPITIYVDPDQSSPSKDGRNAATAGGKRGPPKKQEEPGTGGEDQRHEGAKRAFHESANIIQVRRQPLTMKAIHSKPPANDGESYTHITNSSSSSSVTPALTDSNLVANTRPIAFITPLPSELVNIIFITIILPQLKATSSSE